MPNSVHAFHKNKTLTQIGIAIFGHYSIKRPLSAIKRDHHGSSYEICFLESGMQPYLIFPEHESPADDAKLYRIYGGDTFISFPYQDHSSEPFYQQRGSLYWIQLDSECPTLLAQTPETVALLQNALKSLNRHVIHTPFSVSSRLTEAYRLLALNKSPEDLCRICALLSLYVLELADFNRRIDDEIYRYGTFTSIGQKAVSFIIDHLQDPALDVNAVAKYLNYSRTHAMSTFKKEIGITIHEFIMRSKIDSACDLLTQCPVTEVSLAFNFSSSQHFSNVFKAYTGMTPTDYMRTVRQIGGK